MGAKAMVVAIAASLIASTATAVAVLQFSGGGGETRQPTTAVSAAPPAAPSKNTTFDSACLSAADIYQKLRPAAVEITSTQIGRRPFEPSGTATGSGVVVDVQGTILTNYHVVANGSDLTVTF